MCKVHYDETCGMEHIEDCTYAKHLEKELVKTSHHFRDELKMIKGELRMRLDDLYVTALKEIVVHSDDIASRYEARQKVLLKIIDVEESVEKMCLGGVK